MTKPKVLKQWRLQYQWKSIADFNRYSIRANKDTYTTKWFNGHTRYEDLEKAKKGLYRELVEPYFDAIVGGRNWRLYNTVTSDTVGITIENKQITLT